MGNALTPKEEKIVTWFHRIFRWGLGLLILCISAMQASYIGMGIGTLMIITGFFKPIRCMGTNCTVHKKTNKHQL